MKLIKKNGYKTLDEIKIDLQKTFSHIISNEGDFYFVTITKNQSPHARDLNFQITNGLFNRIWKDYKHSREFTNYIFVIEYPEGTKTADLQNDLPRFREGLGDIPANSILKKTYSATLFGEEGEQKNIDARIEYRVPNSNAIFERLKILA